MFVLLRQMAMVAVTIFISSSYAVSDKHIILFVWDGLRPDSITEKNTPNLYHLKQHGVWFSDHHASYPTLTMMNAASFATGDLAGKTGFYGNVLWDPRAVGVNAAGQVVNFSAPVFTEDYHILQDINQPNQDDPLLFPSTLCSIAQQAGYKTATVGKAGAAFMQNYQQSGGLNGIVFDEQHVYPLSFAQQLQREGYSVPKYTPFAYQPHELVLMAGNGDPTRFGKMATLKAISGSALGVSNDFMYPDNFTSDPTATNKSPYSHSNQYLMHTYLHKILTQQNPALSVVWMRNPDTTEHNYGVGSPSYYTALHDQDKLLGELLQQLTVLKLLGKTDIIIASDHAHSNVSGSLTQFPLRLIHHGMVSVADATGYSVSGDFRPADLLSRAGFHAYDGMGCQYDPVLSGITATGRLVYPIKIDHNGQVCGQHATVADQYGHRQQHLNQLYTTAAHRIPAKLPTDAIIAVGNGGSTYLYVVNHDPILVKKLVRYLQSREEFDVVFVDDYYGQLPGTLPMSLVDIKNPQNRNPDIIVGSHYDSHAKITGMSGIEFNSIGIDRGMHGSFSPIDVHNTLVAVGPDFKSKFVDPLPTGNIDVAPTIAYLLHLDLPRTHGRPLLEALQHGKDLKQYTVLKVNVKPNQPATGLQYQLATDPDGKIIDASKTNYTVSLHAKLLIINGKTYRYFDSAKGQHYPTTSRQLPAY